MYVRPTRANLTYRKPYPSPAAPSRFTRACVIPNLQSAQETLAEIEKVISGK